MSDPTAPSSAESERLARLERTVSWLKIALMVLAVIVVCILIPPIGAGVGFALLVLSIGGGMILFIAGIMYLLNRLDQDSKTR